VVPISELIIPSSLTRPTFEGSQALVLNDVFKSYKILA
jgi:hypothetical protein